MKEGGLVAQAFNCPNPDLPIGHPYCEYRDQPGVNSTRSSMPSNGVGSRGRESILMEVDDAVGGRYEYQFENLYFYIGDSPYRNGAVSGSLAEGAGFKHTWEISGIPNYIKGDSKTGTITYTRDGTVIGTCTIAVIDDDNSAYVGQRNQHPYGGTWRTTPHCFTSNCGWD